MEGEAPRPATVGSIDLAVAGAAQVGQGGDAHVDSQLVVAAEFAPQVRAGAGRGELHVAVLRGQRRPDALYAYDVGEFGRQRGPGDEVPVDPLLPDGAGAVYNNYGDFAGSGRAVGTVGALRDANLGAQAGDLGAVRHDPGALAEHLRRRLLPLPAIVFFSVAVNGLAAGPGSVAAAFDSFSLFLAGMFLIILHVLRA